VLRQNGIKLNSPPDVSPGKTPLREIADALLSAPEALVDRCPY
jgi:hypothetical protein